MEITDALIDKLARLSRLQIDATQREAVRADLQRMVEFIDRLNEVDTEGVEPLTHMSDAGNMFREDAVSGQLTQEEVFQNAPRHHTGFFSVPKIINRS
jgi:aspartyl-tRNA(Asn)/glutamyl-tRNA(Gln) amidotransferase subunit C